jgi:hypothetical protein
MYWTNYGTEWHIGHKMPCRQFDLTDPEELKVCYSYMNLRAEWADDNFRRGALWDVRADMMDERAARVKHLMGNGPDPELPFSELARLLLEFMGDRLIDRAGNSVPFAKRDSL